jgi:hypothetical protein
LNAANIANAISEHHSFKIFKAIALTRPSQDACNIQISQDNECELLEFKLELTCRQFSYRISNLISAGLVMREGRKHVLTCLGKIVYHHTQSMLELAIENHWRLKAIDSIEIYSAPEGISSEEYNKIIDKMIANDNIRAIVRRNNNNNTTSNNSKSLSGIVGQEGHLDEGQVTEERQQIYPLQEIK